MDDLKKEISGRLRMIRDHLKMTPTQLAKATGVDPQTIRDYENSKSIPGGAFLAKLVELGIGVEWLLTGSGTINYHYVDALESARRIRDLTQQLLKFNQDDSMREGLSEYEINDLSSANDDRIEIDYYPNIKGSAGPGSLVDDAYEQVTIKVKVDARLLRERVGNNLNRLKLADVSGDSMFPTLSHGDQVVIDCLVNSFIDNAIYAINQDGYLRYKRIQKRLDGCIIVKSDNPTFGEPEIYKPEEAANFRVVGMVIPFKFGRFKI